jgi:photosynthetic reaction center H subunit
MSEVFIVGGLDVAELVFYIFFLFFLGLVIYIRREDRREGYPLEEVDDGRILGGESLIQRAPPKIFNMPFGRKPYTPETDNMREPVTFATAKPAAPGAPLVPVGDPLLAGIGAGAFVSTRLDEPELDIKGEPKIVPIGTAAGFRVDDGEPDIIGWPVLGADGKEAGKVADIWVDKSDHLVRYLAVSVPGDTVAGPILLPITMCRIDRFLGTNSVTTNTINADQFVRVPRPKNPVIVTRLEEDKITAAFGAGYLYATPERADPWL